MTNNTIIFCIRYFEDTEKSNVSGHLQRDSQPSYHNFIGDLPHPMLKSVDYTHCTQKDITTTYMGTKEEQGMDPVKPVQHSWPFDENG